MGQTPLLCAVKKHDIGPRKIQLHTDNSTTILSLLKYGANPMNTVSANFKSLFDIAINSFNLKVGSVIMKKSFTDIK